MRITGTNIDMMDLTGIMIDGGAATDIVGNLIEGNSGPAITLSAGIWGAPEGIVISSNYYEANNLYPVTVETYNGPMLLCTDLLLLGEPWNQSYIGPGALLNRNSSIGRLVPNFPIRDISYGKCSAPFASSSKASKKPLQSATPTTRRAPRQYLPAHRTRRLPPARSWASRPRPTR